MEGSRFNPAVVMAALLGGIGDSIRGLGAGTPSGNNLRGPRHKGRWPTRLMIQKARNKKAHKLGRTRRAHSR